jgi:hypothetical protein
VMLNGGAVTVITEVSFLVASLIEVAVRLMVGGEGTAAGALYVIESPDLLRVVESVPQAEPEQPDPESDQVKPSLSMSFCTTAVNDCVPVPA